MLADLGNFALLAALVMAFYALAASALGARRHDFRLVESGQRAVVALFLLVAIAVGALWTLLLRSDFHYEYVAGYSNRDLPLMYKIGSLWAGQSGSLLLWTWILTAYSVAAVLAQRGRHNRLLPYATTVMMGTAFFFLLLNNFASNPFRHLVQVAGSGSATAWAAADGKGLNPLLQHPAMVIHPPILYTGYVGFVVPFAFGIAALWTRQLGSAWVMTIRRWTLFAWMFLGTGILLGARWAYVELGWGGYWAWDPVENASLMPWLAGTAFLHSVIVQEKRGMLKVWNVALVCLTYILCILGTFLTRSGVVSSVHSFAQSDIGIPFAIFLVLALAGCAALIISRLPYLRSESRLDSLLSRESGFLFNNLLLLAATFSVLFGTVFPIFSELITGRNVTVGQAYFNRIEVPLGLLLLMLTGVGPLLAYRKTSGKSLRKNFTIPVGLAVVCAPLLFALGVRTLWPLLSLTLCLFVTLTVVQEFHKGALARVRTLHENYAFALVALTRRNNRRYGGYIVHFGIVLVFVGITGSAFTRENRQTMGEGDKVSVGPYTLQVEEISEFQTANYFAGKVTLDVFENGRKIRTLNPEKRFYFASEQPSTEVAIRKGLRDDLYVVYQGMNEDQTKAIVQVYLNPLVAWIWIGGLTIFLGTFLCMVPPLKQAS
jgi:cytochrome c-type biogenesis protein CcmF